MFPIHHSRFRLKIRTILFVENQTVHIVYHKEEKNNYSR